MARGLPLTGVTRTDSGEVRDCTADEEDEDDDDDEDDEDDDELGAGAAGDDDLEADANAANGETANELIDDSVKDDVGEMKVLPFASWSRAARSCAFM